MADAEIPFIPHADFESAHEQDFAEIDCALYVEEDDRAVGDVGHAAANFLTAVEECRILTFEGEQFLFKRLNFLRFRAHALTATLRNQRRPRKTQAEIGRLLDEANDTREEIARSNLRLVSFVCRKISSSSDEFDEFVAEANPILLNAIDKFDFSRGYRFSTYLTHAVQRHIARLIGRACKRRSHELSDGNETLYWAAATVDSDQPSAADLLAAATVVLKEMDEVLDARECFIVRGRFGLDGSEKGKSLRALGDEVGISKERARQILYQSLEKLAKVAQPFESMFAVK
ncbi:sigma-70 family RNA polymerase sigma factor [Allorhodopirellula heiligendammensis]|uniref:RNA polymerase sigma factor SigA n=1 Tax=Allorhodopirellula heiligendammensis TaxID=2714739 RepID=A0A5C6BVU3_9BACT|nr:sigma-70 family RNA polymerase sigma factor [Allorhodopirellula heiligendammensis]TWU15747.1 RNA polymerase sigma factor SigA [Allorhodopirellula heiligendammensis]